MRRTLSIVIVALVAASAASTQRAVRTLHSAGAADRAADSLFDANAIDSLRAFAQRGLERARARGDSVGVGRMTYQRARARQLLRLPGGIADLERALAIARAENDTLGLVNAVGVLSFFAVVDGRIDESLAMNAERIPLAQAIGNRRNEGWGHLLTGYAHLLREELGTAHTDYEKAIAAFRDAGRKPQELTALIGLARVQEREGNIAESRATYGRALALARAVGDRGQEADIWNNLATIEVDSGDLAVAARYFRRAYDLKRAVRAPDVAIQAGNVADMNVLLGSYSAAESVLVDAIAYSREWQNTTGILNLRTDLGDVRAAQGRYAGAVACFRSALAVHGSIEDRVDAATGLAHAYLAQDSVGAALAMLDTHFVDLSRVAPSRWRMLGFATWAKCLRMGGDIDRAGRAARAAWDDAATRADTTGAVIAATELGMCLREAFQPQLAYAWFQRARAMFLASAPRPSEFSVREAQRISLAEPLVELSPVLLDWPRDATRAARERSLFDFLQQIKARTLLERLADPRRAHDIDAAFAQPVSADVLQATVLRDGECLLDYTLAGNEIIAFAVTTRELVMSRIPGARDIRRQVSRYHRLLAQPPAGKDEPQATRAAAESLGKSLLGGVNQILGNSNRLFVATDAWLAALSMETLIGPSGEPLLLEREVVRIPSASLWNVLRARTPPQYARGDAASVLALASQADELQGARREVGKLASRYQHVDRLRAEDRAGFVDAIAQYDVVHVASHVRVDSERPWHSGILLGVDGAASQDSATMSDPYARAATIAAAHSNARVVVLSGCESALGRATQGEGVLGVAAAFFAAGARSVVASIWEVDDRVTADLMERFYRGLAEGKSVEGSLRAAQLEVRQKKPHPFYWAGFVVIGDGDITARVAPRSPATRYGIAALALTAIAVVAWALTRRRSTIAA